MTRNEAISIIIGSFKPIRLFDRLAISWVTRSNFLKLERAGHEQILRGELNHLNDQILFALLPSRHKFLEETNQATKLNAVQKLAVEKFYGRKLDNSFFLQLPEADRDG